MAATAALQMMAIEVLLSFEALLAELLELEPAPPVGTVGSVVGTSEGDAEGSVSEATTGSLLGIELG